MTDEKWDEVVGQIRDTFSVEELIDEPLEPGPGRRRAVVFRAPSGTMKLEYTVTPRVIGTHGVGSKRIGGDTAVAYEYSKDETAARVKAYRDEAGEWVEVNAEALLGGDGG